MELKIKKVIISVTTEDNVTMQKSISSDKLDILGSQRGIFNDTYLELLSGLKERYRDEK